MKKIKLEIQNDDRPNCDALEGVVVSWPLDVGLVEAELVVVLIEGVILVVELVVGVVEEVELLADVVGLACS